MKRILKAFAGGLIILTVILLAIGVLGSNGFLGQHRDAGIISGTNPRPDSTVLDVIESRQLAANKLQISDSKQILFGDFHVHTTFSPDAMGMSLPWVDGEGARPPADACDYARYCSALDFWSINDHAEGMTTAHWQETKESIRQCNAIAEVNGTPDTIAFLGYEWSQMNQFEKEKHYGHKNVIFKGVNEDEVAPRVISAISPVVQVIQESTSNIYSKLLFSIGSTFMGPDYRDINRYNHELSSIPYCAEGVNTKELPLHCREGVYTPEELFRKLDEGGYETIVIPHGNTWGLYTPPHASWDKQLVGEMQNEKYQFLVEVFSGHGNSEEYKSWRPFTLDENGNKYCPEETTEYLPLCRQAGRIIKRNCLAAGLEEQECSQREALAQQHVMDGDFLEGSVPGVRFEEWLDAEQCRDCWAPSYSYRPMVSSQYALAIGNFDEDPENPRRFRFGFMASSDNHTARPGTGFKEIDRRENTETVGNKTDLVERWRYFNQEPPISSELIKFDGKSMPSSAFQHAERAAPFLMTGGLVAVHAQDKSRNSIWDALQKKEVYGTSGDRILLWFDLLNPDESGKIAPMGSEVSMGVNPKFRVKAVGAFKQKEGCPDYASDALSTERLDTLCRGECYNPDDERKLITRIEVIRIKPQMKPNESVDNLIEDSWLVHECKPDADGCIFEFEDTEFSQSGRETVYYVRAIEEVSDMINGKHLRTSFDENGMAVSVDPCYGDNFKTDYQDDCLAPEEERAWSSPIFINYNI